LIRWQQPQRGLLGSDAFMPQTEGTPLGVEVGEWVLRQALADGALWRAQGLALNLHVNVCASHLLEPNFVSRVLLALAERRLQPQDLTLELQETSAVADLARVSRVLDDARNQGLSFALDDFGTGQSSLIGLKHLPVAQLKIDPSVVRDMLDAADDLAILDAILGLAAAFRLETVAEGVESLEHGAMLLQLGCQFAQGYAMARPMPAAAVPGWVAQWARPTAWQGLTPLPHEALPLLRGSIDDRARRRALWRQLELGAAPVGRFDLRDSLLGTWLAGARDAEALRELHLRIHDMGVELQRARERGEPLDGNTVQAMRSAEAELETRLRERLSGRPA
jgi:EAL domain-containing protein (putative c-di-GMP-specific phosphodiesterase class I)